MPCLSAEQTIHVPVLVAKEKHVHLAQNIATVRQWVVEMGWDVGLDGFLGDISDQSSVHQRYLSSTSDFACWYSWAAWNQLW
jgi:hypothetical protein